MPDGKYTALVTESAIIRGTKDPEDLFVRIGFDVVGGPADGRSTDILQRLTVTEEKRVAFLKKFLRNLGYDAPSLSALEAWLPTLVGKGFELVVKTNGQYQNTYINRRVEIPSDGTTGTPLPDNLPF